METLGAPGLVDFVENRLYNASDNDIRRILSPYLERLAQGSWKTLVLGCTHFILLRPWFEKYLPEHIKIIDSTGGVGQRVVDLVTKGASPDCGDPGPGSNPGNNIFYTTLMPLPGSSYRNFALKYRLEPRFIKIP